MTRLDIVNFITGKVGQTDDASKALCVGFVNTRYRMIYDAELWTDSRSERSLALAATLPSVVMPADLERIVAVRCGTEFLDPILEEFLIETDPGLLTAQGTPKYYNEYRDDAGIRGIRVFPATAAATSLYVVAKRAWTPLATDTDVPLLRGIDNALIAYAMGDMLERQRQYAKAQAKFQEAAAHLDALRKLEAEQAAAPRRAKALSTAGDSLGEMADDVAARLGDYSPAARVVIKNFLRRAWNSAADSFPWRDLRAMTSVSVSGGTVDFPDGFARVTAALWNGATLTAVTTEYLAESDPNALVGSGVPTYFSTGGDTRKLGLFPTPSVAGTLRILGRRETPLLAAETDRPTVRGLGSVLAVWALGDAFMARKDERAMAAKQEAATLLKQAQDAESADAFQQRQGTRVNATGDTLAEMAEDVAARLGDYSPESLVFARQALRRAYQTLWDEAPWRDAETTDLLVAGPGGDPVSFPASLDRLFSVRTGTRYLESATRPELQERDPGILERTGAPEVYVEIPPASPGQPQRLLLFPIPTAALTLETFGKRRCPALVADTDLPTLRGSAPVLVLRASAELAARAKRPDAAAWQEEAKGAGDSLRAAEMTQAARARSHRQSSATGDTLRELIEDVCARAGVFDAETRALARQALRRAYQTLWDSRLWRDSVRVDTLTATAGNPVVTRNADADRIVTLRAGTRTLDAVSAAFLAQADPGIFERTGIPIYYRELPARKLALHPTPQADLTLSAVVKLVASPLLADTDTPVVRGAATALVPMALAVVLARHGGESRPAGDGGGSQAAEAEGAAALAALAHAEDEQTFLARRVKPLSVAGDSLSEMADSVCARVDKYDPATVILAKEALRRRYLALWDSRLWAESMVVVRATSDGPTLLLPGVVERVVSVRADAGTMPRLDGMSADMVMDLDPTTFDAAPGTPASFSVLSPAAVAVLPAPGGTLQFVSTDSADQSPVFVRGEVNGAERVETVVLNGTTTVFTASNFDVPLTIAKELTAGAVTVTNEGGDLTLLVLEADEREHKHVRLWLHPGGDCGATYLVLAKRRARGLLQDQDTPQLRACGAALIAGAAADLAGRMGDAKAAAYQAEAEAAGKTLGDLETGQSLKRRQARRRSGAGDTLADLADDVAARVGDYSPETLDAIKQSLRRHARSAWDEFLWRDAVAGIGFTAPGGAANVELPADVDRVLSVRSGERYLDLVPLSFLQESDPGIFERTADLPDYAVELRADAGAARQLALYPVPTDDLDLGLVYKRAMPAFTVDTDLLPLRQGSAALVAMAATDAFMLLNRAPEAETSRAEGRERLAAMQKAELEQAARERRARRRSATGDTLGDLIEEVCARLGTFDPGTQTLARSAVRRSYRWLWDTRLWSDAGIFVSDYTAPGAPVLTFPPEWERVSAIVVNGRPLDVTDLATLWRLRSDALTASGLPTAFYTVPPAAASDPVAAQLFPAPTTVEPYTAAGKRRCPDLVNDADVPLLRGCGSALVALGTAEMLAGAGDAKGADAARTQATGLIAALVDGEVNQGAHIVQIIPTVEVGAYFCGGEGLFW